MRRDTSYSPKTNVTGLVATTAIIVFAMWIVNLAAPHGGSLYYTPSAQVAPAASADLAATAKSADGARVSDSEMSRG
jgi:hypothetical protein